MKERGNSMMKKFLQAAVVTVVLSLSSAIAAFAGTWQADGISWKYVNDDSSYAVNNWVNDNGIWYHFDANGVMQTGWLQIGEAWYYLDASGAMRTADLMANNVTYRFDAAGACMNPYETATPAPAPIPTLTEEQYLQKIESFTQDIITASNNATSAMTNLDSNNIAGAKALLETLKAPFIDFYFVTPPEKFVAGHEKLKSGCLTMVEFIDLTQAFIEKPNLSMQDLNDYISQYTILYDRMIAEIEDGLQLLEAAL